MKNHRYLVILVGVCGTKKSSVGQNLARRLEVPFFDAEKLPAFEKLPKGKLPQDMNLEKWLISVKELIVAHSNQKGCVISCSVLKKEDRLMLAAGINPELDWIYMKGSYEFVLQHSEQMEGHDRSSSLLKSDFETLEVPKRALTIDITNSEQEMVDIILKYLARKYG